jgi:hypothetical protein
MESITIGGLLSRAFSTFLGNFTAFFLIAALVTVISTGILLALGFQELMYGTVDPASFDPAQLGLLFLVSILLYVGFYMVASGAITFGTIRFLNNDPATVAECLSRGLAVAVPLFFMGLIAAFGVAIGLAFFLVPGIILMVMWYAAAPALVVERTGVVGSLSRSAELTKGARWKILGLIFIVYGISFVIGAILEVVTGLFGVLASALIGAIVEALFLAFGAVTAAVVYQELRVAKEGVGISDMAGVFD